MTIEGKTERHRTNGVNGTIFQSGISQEFRQSFPFPGTTEDSGFKYDPATNNYIEVDKNGFPVPEKLDVTATSVSDTTIVNMNGKQH
ncbi:hypothetical protein HYT74_00240 [Candidatus Daviesbacteria bacterium]|nr:hypothetical protein [Candidatus Daviesbacteria bacterium]